MIMPPSISRTATLALIAALRIATSPEETELLERKIMEGNLRFCAYQARRYRQPELELDDLVAVAAAALLDAVRNFNPDKSNHFAAYARRCIRRDLATMVRREGSTVRLPREPRAGEKAAGRKSVAAPGTFSLESLPAEGHALTTENPEDGLLAGIDAERLVAKVAELPDREATIVRLRFGLEGVAPHELAEIGAVLRISKQRVQVILDKALLTLRQSFRAAA